MTFLASTLGPHWLALALVAVGGALRWRGLILLGVGGLAGGFEVAPWVFAAALAVGFFALLRLVRTGAWSYSFGRVLAAVLLLSAGGWLVPPLGKWLADAGRMLRGLEFVRPWWLALLAFVPVVVVMGRRGLSGLGSPRKQIAISCRAAIVALLACALAEPRVKRASEHVTVIFVIDRSFSVPPENDASARTPDGDPLDNRWNRIRTFVNDAVRMRGPDRREDQAGVILFGRRPKLLLPPAAVDRLVVEERLAGPIDGQYTDIAAALKLAMASFPEGTGKRVVLISDGNENLGRAADQALLAKQQGVQIDVVPLAAGYRNENEVLVESVEAPPLTAQGQRLPVRVLVRNATQRPVDGALEVVMFRDREARPVPVVIDARSTNVLEKPTAAGPVKVRLRPGLNEFRFRDRAEDTDTEVSLTYRATFVPLTPMPGDRTTNNRATASVVARGRRKVLFVEDPAAPESHRYLTDTLRRAKFKVDALTGDKLPAADGLGDFLSTYDCVVLANVPAEVFSPEQMNLIRDHVAGQGLGLVMVGGPSSFGPGGYQKTGVEAALPVDCDIKSMTAAGKGGLVLVMHASEMADGNKWQKEIAKLAVQRLGPTDMFGVLYYGAAAAWFIPFQEVGLEKDRFLKQIDRMTPGDMPDFDPFFTLAVDTLLDPKHELAVRHVIVITDGDPMYGAAGQAAVRRMANVEQPVTCTTIGVATHGVNEDQKLSDIAAATKGNFYRVNDPMKLPSIYIKEARRVSQAFLYTRPFEPLLRVRGGPTAAMPAPLPRLHGFVRTSLKPSALAEMAVEGPPLADDLKFPVVAYWPYGAGRSVAFTSDARSQPDGVQGWDRDWVGSDVYAKFWEQTISWAMRSAESGRLAVHTEYREGKVRVVVDARDDADRPMSGITLKGDVTTPRPVEKPPAVEFRRTGPGRFEAEFAAEEAGAYFVNVRSFENGVQTDGRRAGVAVPYSPEFADLETNPALLRRLAEITGGKVFDESDEELRKLARSGDVFRDAPKTVRALLPFWFVLVFAAGMLLVIDVGVRRVSVEVSEVRAWGKRTWARLRSRVALAAESEGLGRLLKVKEAVGETIDREKTTRRFEPDAATTPIQPVESAAPPPPPPPAPPPTAPPPDEQDDFITRMQKAKRRARQERPEDEQP
jgi:uncharacterized membrane protein